MTSIINPDQWSAVEALKEGFFYDSDSFPDRIYIYVYLDGRMISAKVSAFSVCDWILAEAGHAGPTEEQACILMDNGLYFVEDVSNYSQKAGLVNLLVEMRKLGMPVHEMGTEVHLGYYYKPRHFIRDNMHLFEEYLFDLLLQ